MTDSVIDLAERLSVSESDLSPNSPAADVVHRHLIKQVAAILDREQAARDDEPDAVHKMRVGTRRLRSALASFRPLLHRETTDPLRDELKWLAGELGGARDAEVLRERLLARLAEEPDDLVMGPIAARIGRELRADHRAAHDAMLAALDSERYRTLAGALRELAADPPWTDLADGPADEVLTAQVRKALRRVTRLVADEPDPDRTPDLAAARDLWFHEIRKSAKRLRYAAESVEPAFGAPAEDLAAAAENLQEVLGEHQDSVVARQVLRDLAVRIHLDGDNAFTIGRLHALEQARAGAAEQAYPGAWRAVRKTKPKRWLSP